MPSDVFVCTSAGVPALTHAIDVAVEGAFALGLEGFNPCWHGKSAVRYGLETVFEPDCVPAFKCAQLPAEAGAQGVIDAVRLVCDFRDAVRYVREHISENPAVEGAGLVLSVE